MILRLLLLAVLLLRPAPVFAQTPSSLAQMDSLVAAGRTEDARGALTAWWDRTNVPAESKQRAPTNRAELQRAVWLRGLLTVDPTQAAVDYQRLVVEYPGGPYTDRALLRLAQTAEAKGDALRAREHLRTLLRDYPTSPSRLDAGRILQSVEAAAHANTAEAAPPEELRPGLPVGTPAPAAVTLGPRLPTPSSRPPPRLARGRCSWVRLRAPTAHAP